MKNRWYLATIQAFTFFRGYYLISCSIAKKTIHFRLSENERSFIFNYFWLLCNETTHSQ